MHKNNKLIESVFSKEFNVNSINVMLKKTFRMVKTLKICLSFIFNHSKVPLHQKRDILRAQSMIHFTMLDLNVQDNVQIEIIAKG